MKEGFPFKLLLAKQQQQKPKTKNQKTQQNTKLCVPYHCSYETGWGRGREEERNTRRMFFRRYTSDADSGFLSIQKWYLN